MIEVNTDLHLVDKIHSRVDRTIKFIFLSNGQILEFSYIDKQDGKDIVCTPTQTGCRLGCKFCFLTDYDLAVRNIESDETADALAYIMRDLRLRERKERNQVLLVSFMGCGEPLCDTNLMDTMERVKRDYSGSYKTVRFAVASLIPTPVLMERFITEVRDRQLPLKFHLSLHGVFDETRRELMPSASPVQESINLVSSFKEKTGNAAEIHYTLIADVNDRGEDINKLIHLLKGRDVPVKFLAYNRRPSVGFNPSERVSKIRETLEKEGIQTEYYISPGSDIGSSCGQFLMDYYLKYNTTKR